jgi:ankyrin repeat protein
VEGFKASKPDPVFRAIEYLLVNIKDFDVYFPDRDGQSLMHYIDKHGHTDIFEFMIEKKGCNPLCRDRSGRTAWNVAQPSVSADLIEKYVLHKYPDGTKLDKSTRSICVIQLHEAYNPSAKIRFSPT